MPETEKFDIQRREKNGSTWSSWTIIATGIDSTDYSYDSTEEEYTWEDENGFEFGVEYEYQVREHTEPSEWSDGMSFVWNIGEAYRISPAVSLDAVKSVNSSIIEWSADVPADTALTIEAAITEDGTTPPESGWQEATSGQSIPGVEAEADLRSKYLWVKQILGVTGEFYFFIQGASYAAEYHKSHFITPKLHSITIMVEGDTVVYLDKEMLLQKKEHNVTDSITTVTLGDIVLGDAELLARILDELD